MKAKAIALGAVFLASAGLSAYSLAKLSLSDDTPASKETAQDNWLEHFLKTPYGFPIVFAPAWFTGFFNRWTFPHINNLLTSPPKKRSTCVHEAGHAAAILATKTQILYITRMAVPFNNNHILIKPWGMHVGGHVRCKFPKIQDIETAKNVLLFLFAGQAAQTQYEGEKKWHQKGAEDDELMARKIAEQAYDKFADSEINKEEWIESLLSEAQESAKQFVQDNKDKIHKLAQALMEERSISGERIQSILGMEQDPQPSTPPSPALPS